MATKSTKKTTKTKPGTKNILYNVYGCRLAKNENYINLTLLHEDDDGNRKWINSTIAKKKCKVSKDGETVYVPFKFFSEENEEDEEDEEE